MLTLPSGVQTGFSQQDLQSDVSAFDASSINQWWIQTTATPTIIVTPMPTTNPVKGATNFLSSPIFLAGILLVVIIVIAALLIFTRRKKHSKQSIAAPPVTQENPKTTSPEGAFCPSCGNQLLSTEGLCPFCNADLSQWYPKAKK
jgi:hypothetical protein